MTGDRRVTGARGSTKAADRGTGQGALGRGQAGDRARAGDRDADDRSEGQTGDRARAGDRAGGAGR